MFRGILVIVGCGNIHHIMAGKRRVSVEAVEVHRDLLWRQGEGHARAVVSQLMHNVRRPATSDVRGSAGTSVVKSV